MTGVITNWGRKSYKLSNSISHKKVIRNWTNFIRNWDRYYKAGQILQANAD